jgi:hypothetical protein
VELKRPDTDLLVETPYRSEAWRASSELSGAIAQCHATVDAVISEWRVQAEKDREGYPTGIEAHLCRPRSYLIVGDLRQFVRDGRTNVGKFRSFENLRRSLNDPEIITFDELYARAETLTSGY